MKSIYMIRKYVYTQCQYVHTNTSFYFNTY